MVPLEWVPKLFGKLNEVGLDNLITGHPSHGKLFSISKHKGGKELVHEENVVVLLEFHERVKTKLFGDPKGFLEVVTLVKMFKINNLLRANFVSEVGIELDANEFLLPSMKTEIIGVPRQFIHLPLPHIRKLGKRHALESWQAIKLGLFGPFFLSQLSQTSFLFQSIPSNCCSTLHFHIAIFGRVVVKSMLPRETFATTTCTATCESEGHKVAREESKTCSDEGR
jgi:hypothetical protein